MTPARGRVLVVDDDDDIRELLEDILTDRGYETAGAPDGKAALEAAAGFHPTLILLDMRMPVMDGWEFARRYRSKPGDHAHLVVVSAARDARERAESIHADGWLAKPFDLQDLLATVERYASDAGAR